MVHGEIRWVQAHLPFLGILVCTNGFNHEAVQDAGTGRISFVVVYK